MSVPPLPPTFSMRILSLSWTPPSPSCRSANPSGPRPSAAPRGLGTAGRVSGSSRCRGPPGTPSPRASPSPRRRPQVQRPLEPAAPERRRRRHVRAVSRGQTRGRSRGGAREAPPHPLFPFFRVFPPQSSSAAPFDLLKIFFFLLGRGTVSCGWLFVLIRFLDYFFLAPRLRPHFTSSPPTPLHPFIAPHYCPQNPIEPRYSAPYSPLLTAVASRRTRYCPPHPPVPRSVPRPVPHTAPPH